MTTLGHVPCDGKCMACGLATELGDWPLEPCSEQANVIELIRQGFIPLPGSEEALWRMIELGRR